MRAVIYSFILIVSIALVWAIQAPLGARWNVWSFSRQNGDALGAEESLLRAGPAALAALNRGLHSSDPNERVHCAKVLMILGESEGEAVLLDERHAHPDSGDPLGREVEVYLISAWDRRDGPDATLREKLRDAEVRDNVPLILQALNECLT